VEAQLKFSSFLLLLLYFISVGVYAADEIVVTPARFNQSVKEVIPSTIIIDRETIDRTWSGDIADLLRWHAGLDIGRTGGPGQQTSVFTRGTNSNHTAVLINGVKMNSATTGAPALEMIDPDSIERIEIIKGPRSTVYGSDAIGGVINVITKKLEPEKSASLKLSDGRYDTQEQGVDLAYGNDTVSGNFSYNQFDTDGFPATTTSDTDHGHDNDTVNLNVNAKLGISDFSFGFWQADGNTEYDSFGTDLEQDRKNEVFNSSISLPVTDAWQTSLSISRTKDEVDQNQANFLGDEDFAHTKRYVYDWKNDIELEDNIFTFGLSKTQEETESLSFGTDYDESTYEYSAYLQNQLIVEKHSLYASTRYTDNDDFDDSITWNFEYGYNVADNTKIFASIGTGFRAPDSNARYGFGGNPDLEEETSRSIEAGVTYAFNQHTKASIRTFENKIEDLIETILVDPVAFTFENQNVEDARIRGIELSFLHQYRDWHIQVEGITQDPENETEDSRLLRRAKRTLTSSITYNKEQFFIIINGLLTSDRRDFGDERLAGYGLVNWSAGYNFPYATLALKVDNLFDKDYELASGFNTPGQSLYADLRLRIFE